MPEQALDRSSSRAALVLNAALAGCLLLFWLSLAWRGEFWQADFGVFYTGWSMVLGGEGDRLSDLSAQTEYQHRVVPGRAATDGLLPFNHPPHLATVPVLALLPYSAAFYAWALFQAGLLVVMVLLLRRLTRDWGPNTFALLLVTVLAFPPMFMTFQQGQLSLIVLVCLLGFYVSLGEGRPLGTASCLVLGTIKPQLMVVPAFTLLGARRWRELALAAALFATWGLLTMLLLGWSCWPGWLGLLWHSARQFGPNGINPEIMYNLKGALTGLLGAERATLINAFSAAALLLSAAGALWAWSGPAPADKADFALRSAFTLLLGVVGNPHLNPVDALVLVVPAVLFRDYLHRRGLGTRFLDVVLVCAPLAFLVDCYGVGRWPGGARPFFLLMLALLFWMGRALLLERRRVAGPTLEPALAPEGAS
jgi:alpha-1,2-mannosyltransferase